MLDAREEMRRLVMNCARYSGLSALAAGITGSPGAILMLHRVNDVVPPGSFNGHLSVTPAFLDAVLADLKRAGVAIVPMDEAVEQVRSGRPGRGRFAALTFDDAYLDNLTDAFPVLEAHEAPATIYVAPGLTSGAVKPWWEVVEMAVSGNAVVALPTEAGSLTLDCSTPPARRAAFERLSRHFTQEIAEEDQQAALAPLLDLPSVKVDKLFMDWDALRGLARHPLVTLGAHSVHHYNLRRLDADAALGEMVASAATVEAETGLRPRHFAYPYGYEAAVGPREVRLALEAGFASAVTTRHGVLTAGHRAHPHALPRLSLNGRYQKTGHVRTMLSGVTTLLNNRGRLTVTL